MLLVAGLAIVGVVLLPRVLEGLPLSYPIIYVAAGAVLMLLPLGLATPDPSRHEELAERLAEIGVIIALTGSGLKLNRPPGWRSWRTTWRLLGITMPLTIAAVAVLGHFLLGLDPAAALLLGAVLAPTDPVLAADVQVQEPGVEDEDRDDDPEVRMALTSEAGLNDGLAFPFTNAAIAMALAGAAPSAWFGEWLLVDLFYRIGAGVLVGYLAGRVLCHFIFKRPADRPLAETSEGMVVLALTLLPYGLSELVGGYGFLAVFVAAVAVRSYERGHDYHRVLHTFSDQAERLVSAVLLLALGAAAVRGLVRLDLATIGLALLILFVVRPASGYLAHVGLDLPKGEKGVISFFGIRGIGSVYYLAYGLNEAPFGAAAEVLWSAVATVILLSILVHGIAAAPAIGRLARSGSA